MRIETSRSTRAIMLSGNAMISAQAMHRCGSVILRQAQYEAQREESRTTEITRAIVTGKIKNCAQSVMRATRETKAVEDAALRT